MTSIVAIRELLNETPIFLLREMSLLWESKSKEMGFGITSSN